jgi:hypothetical protein
MGRTLPAGRQEVLTLDLLLTISFSLISFPLFIKTYIDKHCGVRLLSSPFGFVHKKKPPETLLLYFDNYVPFYIIKKKVARDWLIVSILHITFKEAGFAESASTYYFLSVIEFYRSPQKYKPTFIRSVSLLASRHQSDQIRVAVHSSLFIPCYDTILILSPIV